MMVKKLFTLLIMLACVFQAEAQQKKILRGRITDKADGLAVIGANVVEYDQDNRTINGTITNVNGDFVLEMRNPSNRVTVSVIGYETVELNTNTNGPISVQMESSSTELDEVVITAHQRSKHGLTNIDHRDKATSSVKVDLIESQDAGFLSASDALQGKVSGLDILAASGDPGSGSTLVIRGLSGMGNSSPLIVIDGIPQMRVSSDFDLSSADSEDISNLINIALQDIKSIEVLKDAASTAIYGSKGADGVLLIETHTGKLGKVQFDYQYKNSINFQPPAIPMLNGDEYIMLQLEEWHNAEGVFEIPDEIAYDRDYVDFYNYSANTDWLGALTQNSITHDHFLKLQGGGDKTRYYTSFNFLDEGGTTINTSNKRFSTRVNLEYDLSSKLMFSVQFSFSNSNREGNLSLNGRNVRSMAYIKAPNMSIWDYDAYGNLTGEYFTPINSYQGSGSEYYNPVAISNLGSDRNVQNNLVNAFNLRYRITPWLTLKENISIQYNGTKSTSFMPYHAIGVDWLDWNVNKAEEGNNNSYSMRTETQIAFDLPFQNKDHVMSGAASWITNQSRGDWMNIQSNKTPSVDIQDPAIDAQINWIGNGSYESREVRAVGNINYKYADKYMLQTIFSADANSSFGLNHRWGFFPGIALGWRFSNEPWMQWANWMDDSKLKASWGITGRQPGSAYGRFASYNTLGNYITNPAIVPTQVQLNNLKWENTSSYDVGVQFNLFDYRLFLEVNGYIKSTTDLLFNPYYIPTSSGYGQFNFLNGGELGNRGWELMFDYTIIRNDNFRWSVNYNMSQNINTFHKLPENFQTENSTSIGNGQYPRRVVEGEPLGSFFGFRYQGVYPTDQDALARDANDELLLDAYGNPFPITYQETYPFQAGDAKYEDVNNDGVIDLNDVVYIGDSNPDFIGGFGSSFKYKNFDLSVAFQYRTGFDIVNGVAISTEGMTNKHNQSRAVLSRFRVEGEEGVYIDGMVPRAYLGHPANNLGSDRYVEAGDFLRLNSIKFGYRLRKDWCDRIGVRSVAFAVSARKMFTLTNYSGQDPEIGQNASDPFFIGVDYARTPPPKMVTLSIAVGF